ncbi:MAG TPA: right-handed parallel beta-helix repeat-containing protein [Gemmataceae bacterium]|nr:right-handed parallel beta-helix repeat-containing protein [Gemmataceae bacterium]
MSLLRWLPKCFSQETAERPSKRHRKASTLRRLSQLTVTILEDRLAPAVLTVNSLADAPISGSSSTLTLREAIALVDTGGTATDASGASLSAAKSIQIETTQPFGTLDTIRFDSHLLGPTQQVITLTVGELEMSRSVTIVGPGASELALSGNNANRVLDVDGQASVSIIGLTVEAGALAQPDNSTTTNQADDGGGINNAGVLRLTESVVSGNSAANSGGIRNTGTLTLTDSIVSGNSAQCDNGGIVNYGGSLTLTDSIVTGNSAGIGNGGIANYSGSVKLTNSTVSGNSAAGGGGIGNYAGTLTITDGTIIGNSAIGDGGIVNTGTLTLTDSTVSGNMANSGGGIGNYGGTLTLDDSTVSANSASGGGGGIVNTGTLLLNDSTVAGNSASGGGGIINTGALTITGSTISGNSVQFDNPGIANTASLTLIGNLVSADSASGAGLVNGGTVTITDSMISENSAQLDNGGIVNYGGSMTLVDSTVSGNSALLGNGGIANYGGALTLVDSTVSGNSALGAGGIGNYGGNMTLQGSTVFGNSAVVDAGILNTATMTLVNSTVSGNSASTTGGIANGGTLSLDNSTVVGNSAIGGAGGILNAGFLTLADSFVAGNSAGSGGGILNAGSALIIDSSVSGNFAGGSDNPDMGSLSLFANTVSPNRDSGVGIVNTGTLTITDSTISGNFAELNDGGIANYGGTLSLTGSTISGNSAVGANWVLANSDRAFSSGIMSSANTGANLVGAETTSDLGGNVIGLPNGSPTLFLAVPQSLASLTDNSEFVSAAFDNPLPASSTLGGFIVSSTPSVQNVGHPFAVFMAAPDAQAANAPAILAVEASPEDNGSVQAKSAQVLLWGEAAHDASALVELSFSDQSWHENLKSLTGADEAGRLTAAIGMDASQGHFNTPDQGAREHGIAHFASEGNASSNFLAASLALVFIAQKSGHERRRPHQHAETPVAVMRPGDGEVLD